MSTGYAVIPFDHSALEWLIKYELEFTLAKEGRYPTPNEVLGVLDVLDLLVERSIQGTNLHLLISDKSNEAIWCVMHLIDFTEKQNSVSTPYEIYFEKGSKSLMVEILSALSGSCGTLILFSTSGETPILVQQR